VEASDLVIGPDVNGFKYDDFEHSADLVGAGELVTRAAIPEIKKWLESEPLPLSTARKLSVRQPAAIPPIKVAPASRRPRRPC
jgi:hypothetical protein